MHEASLAIDLIATMEQVARDHGVARIRAADLEIGALTCVQPEALSFAFEVASRGTVAEGCELRFHAIPLVVSCAGCGYEGDAREPFGCPECGRTGLAVLSGRQFRLVSVDAEDEEEPAEEPSPCT